MDPFSIVADEVALEGLDGITIPSLWIRLEDRKPKFPLKLDDCTKELIWKSLISNTDLKIYQLPKERQDIELFDRYKDIDPETGIETAQAFSDTRKDIYPVHIVENKDGIQGSCALFKERTDITEHVRSKTPLLTLQAALERYGRKLVVVASQALRFRTLIGNESDPDLKLNDDSYCVLERVGRARWQGELQRDLHGCSFKIDARKLHYMRKALVRHGLLSMQSYVTRLKSGSQAGQQQHSILLLLKRFHVNRRTKYDILMEYVSNFLQQSPGQFSTMLTLKDLLNVDEGTFKRVFQYMRSAKLVEYCQFPLEDLDPGAGPCTNKKGNKVLVRCLRLLKPYTGKGVAEDDDDEDEDEDDDGAARRRALPSEGHIMESDVLTQAYHIVISCGPKGIPQRSIGSRMNVGKLESRMICRRLEREGLIKGFMEDEGRQRTTKFISHKCFGVSDKLQQFAKEQERKKLLYSSAPQTSDAAPPTPTTQSMSTAKENPKTPAAKKVKKAVRGRNKDAEEAKQTCGDGEEDTADKVLVGKEGEAGGNRTSAGEKSSVETNRAQPDIPIVQLTPAESDTPACSHSITSVTLDSVSPTPTAEQARVEDEESNSSTASTLPHSELLNADDNPAENNVVLVKDVCKPRGPPCKRKYQRAFERSHETYRLLRRKNLIVEAVRSFKVIEGLFPLQKIINDDEKQDGSSSKCCRKTILRLVDSLSREGLLKVYKTTIIQDGITKNIEMVVHPSVQPKDDIVSRVIEQVRFRISSSYAAVRLQLAEEKVREQGSGSDETNGSPSKAQKVEKKKKEEFQPTRVRGLGKTFGFQPKMHRLRLVHNFLWYLIYGHPLRHNFTDSHSTGLTPGDLNRFDPNAKHLDSQEKQDLKDSVDPLAADCNLDVASSGDEEEALKDLSTPSCSQSGLKVYADEESWKKFMPPVRVHKEFGSGWARVGDLLLCLPLSIFIQVIQINYKVEGLEDYLNDPVKQHHLIRSLPARMRRQLLFRRKYIFSFHENLQKLVYMGLLQFGPVEKFKEKDQVFLYLRRNATIVDTTSAEPHYWLVTESQDKPFEKRQYAFNTAEDVENYWFDLMCVCLNTPLGVIRNKRSATDEENAPSFVHERNVFVGLAYLLKGSREACDDGSIPGDGKGAGGLDSEFFAHLKRNWLWTNHLLAVRTIPSGLEAKENKIRLKSLLSKNALRIALKAGGSTAPRYVTAKRPLLETVEVDIEPASRNQQVVGGKRQKRKRSKKEVVKAPRKKKKEPKKRLPAHDEADHRALKRMTRQRVYWSVQEDSLMMLCSVASQLLNSKLKRAFIPYCLVRDLLQAEFEISMDKTSLAVGRRTRYILKNPQTLLNYRICLAEVYQDKPLMRLLEAKQPADPDNPEDCGKAFSEYARLLRQKFSAVFLSARDMIMPDTKHQLFSRFKVSTIEDGRRVAWKDDLNCTDDIHSIVLHNLIQSTLAMTNIQMKSSRSFQTFHMYSKYNQELLCQVFVQCRKRGLVNRRRVNQPFGPKKNRALPILPMSYQLSQSYYRCFSWRFPHSLCTDSFRFLRNLINNGRADNTPFIAFYHETENRPENGEEVARRTGSERERKRSKRKEDGGKRLAASEPEAQPEKADSVSTKEGERDQSKIEGEEMLMEVSNEKPEATNKLDEQKDPEECLTAGSGEDPSSREKTDDHQPKDELPGVAAAMNEASEDPPDVSDMLRYSMDSPGGVCVAALSLMSLGLLSVYLSIPKQMVVVDSNMVDNEVVKSMAAALEEEDDDDDDGDDCEGKKRLEVKSHQASHTNYLIMRGYCFPGIVKIRNLNTTDNIVVESCIMRLQLRNTPAHNMFSKEISDSPPLDLTKCGPSLLPSILTYSTRFSSSSPNSVKECERRLIEQRGYTPQDIEACAQLRRSLNTAGERGLEIHNLYKTHLHLEEPQSGRTRSLQQYMTELQEEGQVLKVGGLGIRWVLMQHADPWLLTVNSKQWSQSRFTSDQLPFLEKPHNIPFMRKGRRGRQDSEEPPAKKMAVDGQKGEDRRDAEGLSSDVTKEKPNEEEHLEKQKERADDGSGDTLLNMGEGGGKQMQPEEEGGKQVQPEEEGGKQVLPEEEGGKQMQPEEQEEEEEGRKQMQPEEEEGKQMQPEEEGGKQMQPEEQEEEEEGGKQMQPEEEEGKQMQPEEEEEAGKQMLPKEDREQEAGKEKVETEIRLEKRDRRVRANRRAGEREGEACCPPTMPASVDNSENVSFISRPWRMVDGNLNRQVCKGMLEAILYNIMFRPGLTQQSLVEHYKDVLQPMVVLDLVQALIDIGCVTKKTLVKAPKPSLFSCSAPRRSSETKVKIEEPDTVFYEPTISCCLRLSQMLPNERHWNNCLP